MSVVEKLIEKFYPYAKKELRFDKPVNVFLESDSANYKNPLGKTAYYDPENTSITIFIDGRHPKDIMRSFSHELTHHAQNCAGHFENSGPTQEGYAQRDPHLRKMEEDAYLRGNLCFRDWENSVNLKEKNKMTMNEETLRSIIRGALDQILEDKDKDLLEKIKTELAEYKRTNVAGREQGRSALDPKTHEKLREDEEELAETESTEELTEEEDTEELTEEEEVEELTEEEEELEESPGNKREPHARQGRGLTDPSGTKSRGTLATNEKLDNWYQGTLYERLLKEWVKK